MAESVLDEKRRARAKAGGDGWDDPTPLDDPSPTLPEFPMRVFPQALQDLVGQAAESVGCPVDYPAAHALAIAAGAVGASFDLQVKRGYLAPSNLWVCVVAPPGSGKSPAVAPILAPVYREHMRRQKPPEEGGKKNQLYVSDVTVEKLAEMLCDNPRGLTMIWDEMAGWLTSFNQYKAKGAGNDRSHYLSVWDGRPLKVDRKGKDSSPLFVAKPRLSVVGGIQPEVLDSLRAGPSDGLFDRMLFAYPADPGMAVETWAEVNEAPCNAWAAALQKLWEPQMRQDSTDEPKRPAVMKLNDDAKGTWQGWTREIAEMAAAKDAASYFRSVGAKISGYAARIAMVIHRLREAYGEQLPWGVGQEDMLRGVAIAHYFLKHADRVHRAAGRDKTTNAARVILAWAQKYRAPQWTMADAWASLRHNTLFDSKASGAAKQLEEPLKLLELHRIVRWAPADRGGPGRPAESGKYTLNPKLWLGVNGDSQTV